MMETGESKKPGSRPSPGLGWRWWRVIPAPDQGHRRSELGGLTMASQGPTRYRPAESERGLEARGRCTGTLSRDISRPGGRGCCGTARVDSRGGQGPAKPDTGQHSATVPSLAGVSQPAMLWLPPLTNCPLARASPSPLGEARQPHLCPSSPELSLPWHHTRFPSRSPQQQCSPTDLLAAEPSCCLQRPPIGPRSVKHLLLWGDPLTPSTPWLLPLLCPQSTLCLFR